jgi:hypothetical protein
MENGGGGGEGEYDSSVYTYTYSDTLINLSSKDLKLSALFKSTDSIVYL